MATRWTASSSSRFSLSLFFVLFVSRTSSAYEFVGKVTFVEEEAASTTTAATSFLSAVAAMSQSKRGGGQVSRTLLLTRSGDVFVGGGVERKGRGRRSVRRILQQPLTNAPSPSSPPGRGGDPLSLISEDALEIATRAMATTGATTKSVAGVVPLPSSSSPWSSERTLVRDPELFPYSAVGMLIGSRSPEGSAMGSKGLACSGSLISRRHVLTAAHCVFDLKSGGSMRSFVSSLDFYPARKGSEAPLGRESLEVIPWKNVKVLEEFVSRESYDTEAMNLDFALVTLEREADEIAGFLALRDPGTPPPTSSSGADGGSTLEESVVETAGYPTGMAPDNSMWRSSCSAGNGGGSSPPTSPSFFNMWGTDEAFSDVDECSSPSNASACANIGAHSCLSTHGQSGSPMWKGSGWVVAVLTGSVTTTTTASSTPRDAFASSLSPSNATASPSSSSLSPTPVATKIDPFVHSVLRSWAAEDPEAGPLATEPSGQMPRKPAPRRLSFWGIVVDLGSKRDVAVFSCCVAFLSLLAIVSLYLFVFKTIFKSLRSSRRRKEEMEEWKRGGRAGGGRRGVVVAAVTASSGSTAV